MMSVPDQQKALAYLEARGFVPYVDYGWLYVPQWTTTDHVNWVATPANLVVTVFNTGDRLALQRPGLETLYTGLYIDGEPLRVQSLTPGAKRTQQTIRRAHPDTALIARFLHEVHLPPLLARGGNGPNEQEAYNLSIEDAAQLLGISRRAVSMAVEKGRIRAQKVASKWWLSESSVAAYKPSNRGRKA